MQVTLADELCSILKVEKPKFKVAEITIAATGKVLNYNTGTVDPERAFKKALNHIMDVQLKHGEVYWKFKGDKVSRIGTQVVSPKNNPVNSFVSTTQRVKVAFEDFFFPE